MVVGEAKEPYPDEDCRNFAKGQYDFMPLYEEAGSPRPVPLCGTTVAQLTPTRDARFHVVANRLTVLKRALVSDKLYKFTLSTTGELQGQATASIMTSPDPPSVSGGNILLIPQGTEVGTGNCTALTFQKLEAQNLVSGGTTFKFVYKRYDWDDMQKGYTVEYFDQGGDTSGVLLIGYAKYMDGVACGRYFQNRVEFQLVFDVFGFSDCVEFQLEFHAVLANIFLMHFLFVNKGL